MAKVAEIWKSSFEKQTHKYMTLCEIRADYSY